MIFHVGDRVRILSEKKIRDLRGRDVPGDVDGLHFNSKMFQYCGKTGTIRSRYGPMMDPRYEIEGFKKSDGGYWSWNKAMFEMASQEWQAIFETKEFDESLL
jgi:hypothetical protein